MPRRGITFDRYEVPRHRGETVRYPTLPADTSVGDAIAQLGGTASRAILQVGAANRAKEDLAEKVKIGERYLQASMEMEGQLLAIQQDPKARERAGTAYGQWEEGRMSAWTEGLTDIGAEALRTKLVEKRLGSVRAARTIEVKDLQDRTDVTITMFARRYVDTFVRGGVDGLDDTAEFNDLKEAYGVAVGAGAKDKNAAAKELLEIRKEAAAARAHSQILGGDAKLQHVVDLFEQERQAPGSTYLGMLDAGKRLAIEKTAKDEQHTMSTRRRDLIDRARKELDAKAKEQQENWLRRSDSMMVDGTLTQAWIEDGKHLGLVDDDKARFYRTAIEKRATGEEGPNDGPTFRRLAVLVDEDAANPRKVIREVEEAYASGRLNWATAGPWRARLYGRIDKESDRSRSEDLKALDNERTEVKQWVDILTTTRSPFERFDPQANRLRLSLREELGRLPENESAKAWYFKNQAQFYGRMRGLATQFIKTERDAMLKKDYETIDDIAKNESEYKRKFGADWEAKMLSDVERMERITGLQAEIDAKKPEGGNAPGPKPSDQQQTKKPAQKSSGPVQAGKRS